MDLIFFKKKKKCYVIGPKENSQKALKKANEIKTVGGGAPEGSTMDSPGLIFSFQSERKED